MSRRACLAWLAALGCCAERRGGSERTAQSATSETAAASSTTTTALEAFAGRDHPHALSLAHPSLQLPRAALGMWPTPVLRCRALGETLGIAQLHVKQDGLAASPYGGGKIRKLEHCLAPALELPSRKVVTFGGFASNHCVATAVCGKRLGLAVELWLAPQPPTKELKMNLRLAVASGAVIRAAASVNRAHTDARRRAKRRGRDRPHLIAPGGSSILGNLGFVSAAFELAQQVEAGDLKAPDVLYVAMGTMGAAAGLAVGLHAAGLGTELVAVRASSPATSSARKLYAMCDRTAAWLRRRHGRFAPPPHRWRIRIEGRQLGRGYARSTAASERAVALAHSTERLLFETTYTGKCLAALMADARSLEDKVVLLYNTNNAHSLPTPAVDCDALPSMLAKHC